MPIEFIQGDCLQVLLTLAPNSVDAVVTDPPYHLTTGKKGGSGTASLNLNSPAGRSRITTGFMSLGWDGGDIAMSPETWRLVYDTLKPGGHLLAFSGTRTSHRMVCAIEDAGFEIRDTLMWVYGSGMSKGINISKAIDKHLGAERKVVGYDASRRRPNRQYEAGAIGNIGGSGTLSDRSDNGATLTAAASPEAVLWDGWHSSLKPSYEPIIMARKPLDGTVINNILKHGVGALNIDACRIPIDPDVDDHRLGGKGEWSTDGMAKNVYGKFAGTNSTSSALGRFPANLLHDGSPDVLDAFAAYGTKTSGIPGTRRKAHDTHSMAGRLNLTGDQKLAMLILVALLVSFVPVYGQTKNAPIELPISPRQMQRIGLDRGIPP
jgi:hypothetical protein